MGGRGALKVSRIFIEAFRNLAGVDFVPSAGVNVIYGENGQGKTNLLEAIWLFSGAKSFRGAKEAELIPIGGKQAGLSLWFSDCSGEHQGRIRLGEKKEILFDGLPVDSAAALSGNLCCVVFSPVHLSLIKGGPAERRRCLDIAIGQIKPRYQAVLTEYHRLLVQRGALLRDAQYQPALIDTLEVWDEVLARRGALITRTRQSFVQRLAPFACEFYRGISTGREEFSLCYCPSAGDGEAADEDAMIRLLRERRADDLRTGTTSVGPHRDDLDVRINGVSARAFGSQGQQRSGVLAIKLAESALIEEVVGQPPVILLDDVMSELDFLRRDYLLHRLTGRQILITCCDPDQVSEVDARFEMKNGRLC
ncbi:MAG: DNA replication and repair protein RecF [Oscillospiraceae bacterium]|nr:MAG: DNA replication and repair protein RecF [Oscillospiraceae bacterium]